MSQCGSCNDRTSRYDETIQCNQCLIVFHLKCANISVERFVEMRHDSQISTWCCTKCLQEKPGDSALTKENEDKVMSKLNYIIDVMNSKFNQTNESIKELTSSQQFLSSKYEEIIKKLELIPKLELKVDQLEKQLETKNVKIKKLDDRLRHQEQYSRVDMIELREVMEKPNEKTEDVVVKVIEKMGVPFSEQDIAIAHRLRGMQGKTRGIIVKLNSRGKKTEILKYKKKNFLSNGFWRRRSNDFCLSQP